MKWIQTVLFVPCHFLIGIVDSISVWRYLFWIQSQSKVKESLQKITINAFILLFCSSICLAIEFGLQWLFPEGLFQSFMVFLNQLIIMTPVIITLSVFNFFALQDMILLFAKMKIVKQNSNTSISKKLNAVAFEILRLLSLLFAKLLIRFIPRECAFVAVALIESYTIFDCWWCLGPQTVLSRLQRIESNPFYFFGFGFIPAYLLCFGSLLGSVLYQLFTPFFVLAALFRSQNAKCQFPIPFATGFVHLSSVMFLLVVRLLKGLMYLKECLCCCSKLKKWKP